MDITKEAPQLEEFFEIYPKISLKIEPNEKDKLIKFFNIINKIKRKKSSIILDTSQLKKLMKLQNKSQASSLNFENKAVLSIQKINNANGKNENNKKDKVFYRILQEDEDVEKYVDKLNEDLFLINKGIEEQNRKLKRTADVKRALGLFIEKSDLIQKLSKDYGITNNLNPLEDKNLNERIKDRIKNLISNLADNVFLEKYEKDKFIIRKNEIGKDCYFLLSGRLSILKPVEYKYIKISYENYLKYLLNVIDKKEKKIFDTVTNLNWLFIKIYNEENLMEIIKYYIQKRISVYSNISYDLGNKNIKEDLTLENIESFLFEFKLKFEDFGISKDKIISDIKKINFNENSNDFHLLLNNYFRDIFKIDKRTQILMSSYDFLFEKDNNGKDKLVTLYKYENFLTLSPGAFFGEMSLNSENKKRNASIRTETDCIVASLSIEKYANYLMDENKKILMRQINFICNNFFFNNISQRIFSKYYFSMFKLINISKENIIYEQGSDCNSIFFIRDGTIKYEINASISEIHNLIYFLISGLKNSKAFKLNNQLIDELKSTYLKNHNLINMRNASIILLEKINDNQKFELSLSESFEVLGLPEFFFEIPYTTTCSVISPNARLFELSRHNLNDIISYEKGIKDDLNKLIFEKIVVFIKRLFNIENNFIKIINSKIDSNFYKIYDTNFFNYINFEKHNNLFEENKNNSKDFKEEEKNKKIFNEKDDLILIKKFSKIGYVNADVLKNKFYSPIKFNKKIINPKLMSEIKNLNSSQSQPNLNLKKIYDENIQNKERNLTQKSNDNIINNLNSVLNEKLPSEEEKQIIPKKVQDLIIKTKLSNEKIIKSINKSNSNNNIFNLNNSIRAKPIDHQTIINIGKSCITLPKLRKLLISSGKPKEKNLSIVQNQYKNIGQISESHQDIALNEDETFNNEQNNKNEKISLPEINRQNSCFSLPINKRIKKRINKSMEYKQNLSEMNRYSKQEDEKNILVQYIKHFYQKQKIKGYSAILNPKFNTIIKKKVNKSLSNLLKK